MASEQDPAHVTATPDHGGDPEGEGIDPETRTPEPRGDPETQTPEPGIDRETQTPEPGIDPQTQTPERGGDRETQTPEPGGEHETETAESRVEPGDERRRLNLTDPKAIRALAHPLRLALLEALGQAGTLTATQASEMLGESPANCAFHLRTLAKYGFVEEAGGGRGRERPWRQSYDGMTLETRHDDPPASKAAAQALNQVWMDRLLSRARRGLTSPGDWPKPLDDSLGTCATTTYVTPEEAAELHAEIQKVWDRLFGTHHRFAERRDPKLRPENAMPIEFVLLAYPLLDLPPVPDQAEHPHETAANEGGRAEDGAFPDESASPA